MACFNMIKNHPNQKFELPSVELQGVNDLKSMIELAIFLVALDVKAQKYISITDRIQKTLEDTALQESLNISAESGSWCNIL